MPIRSGNPLAAAFAQSNDIQQGLGNLFAPFSPVNTMQAGLLKAQTDLAQTKADIERKQFGLEEQKQPYTLNVLSAHAAAEQARAKQELAHGGLYEAQTQQITRQWDAQKQLPKLATAVGMTPDEGSLFGAIVQSSGDSNANNIASALNAVGRRNVEKGAQGEQLFFAPGDPRVPKAAPQPQQSVPFLPQVQPVTPFSSANGAFSSIIPQLPQEAVASKPLIGPSGDLTAAPQAPIQPAVQANPGYTVSGNTVSVGGNPGKTMTPLNKAKDEYWGKAIGEYQAKGTAAEVAANLAKIDNTIGKLKNDKTLTGVSGITTGMIPDPINRGIGNNDAVDARESMESAVSDTLRATLGAAFTEKEGTRTLKLAFNPMASPAENIRRAKLTRDLLASKTKIMEDATEYADTHNGSMEGFKAPSVGSHKDFNDELEAAIKSGKSELAAPASGAGASDDLVPVIDPNGKSGRVLRSKLPEALKRGFKQK